MSQSRKGAFRCSIAPEHSSAELRIGRRKYAVNVLDTSRDGFTLRCSNKVANAWGERNVRLNFRGDTWEIRRMSSYNESSEAVHVGCKRLRELTKIEEPTSGLWSLFTPKLNSTTNDPTFLMFLIVAFLFACVSLPGLGDKLGTAPKIRSGVEAIFETVDEMI